MTDPKYAGLPGIAPPDEKDVYETEDLPEADQELAVSGEAETETIVRPHIDVQNAYGKFRGKQLLPDKDVDFSDRAKPKGHYGYYSINGEFEVAASGDPETLMQRYHRVQAEMHGLLNDIKEASAKSKDLQKGEAALEKSLVPNLEASLEQLRQIKLAEAVGSANFENSEAQIKKLMAQVEQLKAKQPKGKNVVEKGSELVVKYNLQSLPAHSQFTQISRLADLDARLKHLETILGANPDNINRLKISEFENINEAVSEMNARLSVLDAAMVEKIDARLGGVIAKMDTLSERRGGQQLPVSESKVNEMYESCKKTEALAESLAPLAERLTALMQLHQEAANFRKNLTDLKLDSSNMGNSIAGLEAELKNANAAMEQVLKTVTANIASFNERLTKLSK